MTNSSRSPVLGKIRVRSGWCGFRWWRGFWCSSGCRSVCPADLWRRIWPWARLPNTRSPPDTPMRPRRAQRTAARTQPRTVQRRTWWPYQQYRINLTKQMPSFRISTYPKCLSKTPLLRPPPLVTSLSSVESRCVLDFFALQKLMCEWEADTLFPWQKEALCVGRLIRCSRTMRLNRSCSQQSTGRSFGLTPLSPSAPPHRPDTSSGSLTSHTHHID